MFTYDERVVTSNLLRWCKIMALVRGRRFDFRLSRRHSRNDTGPVVRTRASITEHYTGWTKKVIPVVQCNICTRGITFLAHLGNYPQLYGWYALLVSAWVSWTRPWTRSVQSDTQGYGLYSRTPIHTTREHRSSSRASLVWARAILPHISSLPPLPHLLLYLLLSFTFRLSLSYSLHLFSSFFICSYFTRIVG